MPAQAQPTRHTELLCCPGDFGPLTPDGSAVRCETCSNLFELEGGIVRLVGGDLHPETARERRIRDEEARRFGPPREYPDDADPMATTATMRAVAVERGHRVLELGAGTGRFTRLLAQRGAVVVAADVSTGALQVARRHVGPMGSVIFVEADATRSLTTPGRFDRVLCTMASNLPGPEQRRASYAAAARALAPDGRFVFTTHHYGVRARLAGEPRVGRYHPEGVYRELLTPSQVRAELTPYFGRVRVRPLNVVLPLTRRLRLHSPTLDRIGQRIPLVRGLGELLLVSATKPRLVDAAA